MSSLHDNGFMAADEAAEYIENTETKCDFTAALGEIFSAAGASIHENSCDDDCCCDSREYHSHHYYYSDEKEKHHHHHHHGSTSRPRRQSFAGQSMGMSLIVIGAALTTVAAVAAAPAAAVLAVAAGAIAVVATATLVAKGVSSAKAHAVAEEGLEKVEVEFDHSTSILVVVGASLIGLAFIALAGAAIPTFIGLAIVGSIMVAFGYGLRSLARK